MKKRKYDSRKDTLDHIDAVRTYLEQIRNALHGRANAHDKSKLKEPEKSFFDKHTPLLATLTYGSDEYNQALSELQPALKHHYQANAHHPEHYAQIECNLCFQKLPISHDGRCPGCMNDSFVEINGVNVDGMNLLDIVEMFADWKAATERYNDGDLRKSLEINAKRFKLSPQLYSVLKNTIDELGW